MSTMPVIPVSIDEFGCLNLKVESRGFSVDYFRTKFASKFDNIGCGEEAFDYFATLHETPTTGKEYGVVILPVNRVELLHSNAKDVEERFSLLMKLNEITWEATCLVVEGWLDGGLRHSLTNLVFMHRPFDFSCGGFGLAQLCASIIPGETLEAPRFLLHVNRVDADQDADAGFVFMKA